MEEKILISWFNTLDFYGRWDSPFECLLHNRKDFSTIYIMSVFKEDGWIENDDQTFGECFEKLKIEHKINLKVIYVDTTLYDYRGVYESVIKLITKIKKEKEGKDLSFFYNVSSGSYVTASILTILANTIYPATLIQCKYKFQDEHISVLSGDIEEVSIPFKIAADYEPTVSGEEIALVAYGKTKVSPAFEDIIHDCQLMKDLISRSQKIAQYNVPVLIQGDSGTGKELFAEAIHNDSPRKNVEFLPVNCGAIPDNMFESEFFGYVKGAYTDAKTDKAGHFEIANGGTIFLDEVGELPHFMQVKLLRVLQEGKIKRVGSSVEKKVNVRIIAATNRDLSQEVAEGRFREDLFYRLAVGIIHLPNLKERGNKDIRKILDFLMKKTNNDLKIKPSHKMLSDDAKAYLLEYGWPGNVREMQNTLTRAIAWSRGQVITKEHIEEAILEMPKGQSEKSLSWDIGEGFNVNHLKEEIEKFYIEKALSEVENCKTKAAKLLGIKNYQTLDHRMEKYKMK